MITFAKFQQEIFAFGMCHTINDVNNFNRFTSMLLDDNKMITK